MRRVDMQDPTIPQPSRLWNILGAILISAATKDPIKTAVTPHNFANSLTTFVLILRYISSVSFGAFKTRAEFDKLP